MSSRRNGTSCATVLAAAMVLLWFGGILHAQTAEPSGPELVREGNRLLAEDRFEDALEAYEAAQEKLPARPEVAYNRGLAHYRLGDYAAAESAFQDAMARATPELEAAAKYNLGRCAHAAALANREDMQVAINDLTKAINYYDDALQVLPEEPDAVKNRALADRMRMYLEKRLEAQKEQQQQPTSQPSSQPDQPQTSQPTSQPNQQPTSQPQDGQKQDQQQGDQQQDQQQQQQAQQGDEKKDEQQGNQAQDQQQGQQDEQKEQEGQQAKEGERKELTPEEAEGMLQEARDAERQRREDKRQRQIQIRGRAKVEKDW